MGAHLIDGEFQSDKYPTCPRGKVPLSVKDASAQDLLWDYAERRRSVDAEFSDDLQRALLSAGYVPVAHAAAAVWIAEACVHCGLPFAYEGEGKDGYCNTCRPSSSSTALPAPMPWSTWMTGRTWFSGGPQV